MLWLPIQIIDYYIKKCIIINMDSISRREFLKDFSAVWLASLTTRESVARNIQTSVKNFSTSHSGNNLWKLHSIAYKEFIESIENILRTERVRIVWYNWFINRNNIGVYTLTYTINYTSVGPQESPHRHVELTSTVWRETWSWKTQAIQKNKVRTDTMNKSWSNKFRWASFFDHASWDDDLYQVWRLYVAENTLK